MLEREKSELSQSLEAALKRSKELADENDSLESSSQAQLKDSDELIAEKARANDLKGAFWQGFYFYWNAARLINPSKRCFRFHFQRTTSRT